MSNIPMKPGYYWAKLRIPAEGTHEAELWDTQVWGWEIVQVNENCADWADNPAEDEALSVSVPGIRETQWRDGFIWGEFVAPLENIGARPKPAPQDDLGKLYNIREALGFTPLHPLSHLDSDAKAMRTALIACAPLAHAAIEDAGKDRLGYIGGADTESKEPVALAIRTTLGAVREARRALFVANVHPAAVSTSKCGEVPTGEKS